MSRESFDDLFAGWREPRPRFTRAEDRLLRALAAVGVVIALALFALALLH